MLNTKDLLRHKQQDLKWKRLLEECDFADLKTWAIDKLVDSCGKQPYTLHGGLFFECLQQEQAERQARATRIEKQQAKKTCADCLHLSKQSNEQPCCNCLALADCTSELVLFYHEKALR